MSANVIPKKPLWQRIVARFKSKTIGERITYTIVFLIFAFFAFSYLYMFLWAFLGGLKSHNENVMNPFGFPTKAHFENYLEVFSFLKVKKNTFWDLLKNSIIFACVGPLLSEFFTAAFAYATAKYKFPGSKIFFPLAILVGSIPIYGTSGADYILRYNLGTINSYTALLFCWGGLTGSYLLYYTTFKSLSWSFAEAALIDGANEYQVYFRVMFPQIINMFGALYITSWIAEWNNYSTYLITMRELPTIAAGLYLFDMNMQYHVRVDILYAGYFLASLPSIVLFALFSKTLLTNVSLGGIKE